MRFLPFSALAICWYAMPQAQAQITEESAVPPEMIEQVADFLREFIDPEKSPQEQAALFAHNAEYYDQGQVSSEAIARDVARYARRWPLRNYRLSAIHYIKPDPASGRVFVSYEIAYSVANSSKTVNGRANYGAVIGDLMQTPKIEWIKERVYANKLKE